MVWIRTLKRSLWIPFSGHRDVDVYLLNFSHCILQPGDPAETREATPL